ncbi:hypothetical protein BH23GEM9_BH23GEM9_32700 [soil metagenome]
MSIGAGAVALVVVLLVGGCRPSEPLERRLERDVLERQKAALVRELGRDMEHDAGDVVISVPASLVDNLLEVALPVQIAVDRFIITADSAHVDFDGGLALVRIAARVEWADRDNVSAAIELLGTLEILEIDESGTLAARVEILGFETGVQLGALSAPAGRLLSEFARRPAEDLNALLSRIEIPVRLLPLIPLPAVDEDEVTIPAVDVPLDVRIRGVRVGGGRLRVHVNLALAAAGV